MKKTRQGKKEKTAATKKRRARPAEVVMTTKIDCNKACGKKLLVLTLMSAAVLTFLYVLLSGVRDLSAETRATEQLQKERTRAAIAEHRARANEELFNECIRPSKFRR